MVFATNLKRVVVQMLQHVTLIHQQPTITVLVLMLMRDMIVMVFV